MNAITWTVGLTVSPTSMKTTRCGKRRTASAQAHVVKVTQYRKAEGHLQDAAYAVAH